MSFEVMSEVMLLKPHFELLSLRLFVRSTVSNPLIIGNFKTLQEISSKCKIMEFYRDFVSLQVHPSASQSTICASLSESYSSILSVDTSLKEAIKIIPDNLRWMTIPNIFVERHGHPNGNHFYTDGSLSAFCIAHWQNLWDTDELGRFLYSISRVREFL